MDCSYNPSRIYVLHFDGTFRNFRAENVEGGVEDVAERRTGGARGGAIRNA